jgi:hypothetical protein
MTWAPATAVSCRVRRYDLSSGTAVAFIADRCRTASQRGSPRADSRTDRVMAAIVVAGICYVATARINRADAIRADRIDRLNAQLRDLYGPLMALVLSTNALFQTWRQRELPLPNGWAGATAMEQEEWRHWMATVFMPLNRRIAETIIAHEDLVKRTSCPRRSSPCVRMSPRMRRSWSGGIMESTIASSRTSFFRAL